ncbi:MAG: YHS domain-containing (seleno)protein [Planctomycetota bacterium]
MGTTPKRSPLSVLTVAATLAAVTGGALADLPPANTSQAAWSKLRTEHYQLAKKKTLGAQGYDVVAYFPEGDPKGEGKPTKGNKKITYTYNGVTYRFSSNKNRELFKANPLKYEPAYGGWCAYAISKETYTEPNPKRFTIQNGRLLLFYDGLFGDTYKDWFKEGPQKLEPEANSFWKAETGERPPSEATDEERAAAIAP